MVMLLSVTQVNTYIKSLIDGDGRLKNIMVSGEISNFTDHYKSGHLYFSLKDSGGVIKAVMFSDSARRLKFLPKDGMKVIVGGRISVYESTGQYQVYVQSMQPDGLGALNLAYEQLKEKLSGEGLFDRRLPLPAFPERIAVITSPTGAAVHDITGILERRWPVAKVLFCPSAVQGDLAEGQLVEAVEKISSGGLADLIIIGRGGGSMEDLWAFNSEALARAIYNCKIPVISAVGHETDFTICDFVSDLRAPTPSAAAELAVPNIYDMMSALEGLQAGLEERAMHKVQDYRMLLDRLVSANSAPAARLLRTADMLEALTEKLHMHQKNILNRKKLDFAACGARLDALSPLKILSRGYSVLTNDKGEVISSVKSVSKGEKLTARLMDGTLTLKAE